jgi:Ca2+-binding RTX toxin-like protein
MVGFDATGSVTGDPFTGTDTLLNVERVIGSDAADTYTVLQFVSFSQPGGFPSIFNSFEGRGGDDIINGNGATRIEYSGATGPVTVDFAAGTADGDASVGHDVFTGVNSVRASSHADMLFGSDANETFDGRGGNDTINGMGGFDRADYAFNGPSAMGITVNLAAGTVVGDPTFTGNDTLISIEAIRGTHLADTYNAAGFLGLNEFEGMAGNDTAIGNGETRLSYANAREGVSVVAGTSNVAASGTTTGGASVGTDTFHGVNAVRGSNFDDLLDASPAFTFYVLEGGRGDDTLLGSFGHDTLLGGEGNDLLRGNQGSDVIDGGPGSDTIDFNDLFIDRGDQIFNFEAFPGGDVIDIADLLAADTSYAGGAIADYVRIRDLLDGNSALEIDTDGAGMGADWVSLATLIGFTGLSADDLLASGNLDVSVL